MPAEVRCLHFCGNGPNLSRNLRLPS